MACFGFWTSRKTDIPSPCTTPWYVTGIPQQETPTPTLLKQPQIQATSFFASFFGNAKSFKYRNDIMRAMENKGETTQNDVSSTSDGKMAPRVLGSGAQTTMWNATSDSQPLQIVQNQPLSFGTLEDAAPGPKLVENLPIPPCSEYSSASGGATSDEDQTWAKTSVFRCESSDSAIVQSDEENYGGMARGIRSPYSPRGSVDHVNVPSRTLIEAQLVHFPIDRKFSDTSEFTDIDPGLDSRRQSCFTDDGDEASRYRYWRTPSVVVSDYSDGVMGLTLEDVEYIRNHRKENCSSPESSLNSSCSNIYGSLEPMRKTSECSTCSTLSFDDEENDRRPSPWKKVRSFVAWTPFFQTYKKHRYPWVQLAGHQGNFKAGPDQGTILKKLCVKEEKCFKILMDDSLKTFVPEYKGLVASDDGDCSYIQLEDLLGDFISPCVMDCKIGVRTYLEEELAKAKEKPKLRKDMYEKMCQVDDNAPTEEEHKLKGVTKPRYMVWRETISSTATLGFRIEGIRKSDGTSSKDFKTTKTKGQVMKEFLDFTETFPHAVPKYIHRLEAIKKTLQTSNFFHTHEVIGSSLLFVHDQFNANVWLIDFAKTILLPENVKINHSSKWKVGSHEDGYLIGVNNIISLFKTILEQQPVPIAPPLVIPDNLEINDVSIQVCTKNGI